MEYDHSFLPHADRPLVAAQVWHNLLGGHPFNRMLDKGKHWQQARVYCNTEIRRMIKRKEAGTLRYDFVLRDRSFSLSSSLSNAPSV